MIGAVHQAGESGGLVRLPRHIKADLPFPLLLPWNTRNMLYYRRRPVSVKMGLPCWPKYPIRPAL
jgi:hypothetical protein